MSYVGNSPTTQSFTGGMDSFNGNASNTVFGLSRTLNTAYDADVYVENVWQRPDVGYSISANTITFSSAPSSGSNNVVVVYRNFTATTLQPADGSVSTRNLGTITNINAGTNAGLTLQANNATVITANATGAVAFATNTATFGTSVYHVANGNVGFGVSSPAAHIDVQTANNTTVGTIQLRDSQNRTVAVKSPTSAADAEVGTTTNHDLIVRAGTTGGSNINLRMNVLDVERARINSNGDIGIGNSSPVSRLHVTAAGANGIVLGTDTNDSTASARIFGQTASSTGGIFWYHNSGNPMWCINTGSTIGSATGTTRLTVSQYGLALGNYDAATSGTGIKFPASQNASSDANTLDDYEEGTWTPAFIVTYGSSTWGSYTHQVGKYIKIGRFVHCTFSVGAGSFSVGGNIGVSGLPFTVATDGGMTAGGARESAQTGNWYQAEGVSSNQIGVLRRYDNSGFPNGNVSMQGFIVYQAAN